MAPLASLLTPVILLATSLVKSANAQAPTPDTTPLAKFDYTENGNCSRFRCIGRALAANFPAYKPGALQDVDKFINYKYTGIANYYYFVTTKTGFKRRDAESTEGMVNFTKAAYQNGMLPCMVIGAEEGSQYFSDQFSTRDGRVDFATQLVDFMYTNKFRCVHLDWQFPGRKGPGCNKFRKEDTENYIEYLVASRGYLGPGYNITVSVPMDGFTLADGSKLKDYSKLTPVVDWFTLLPYQYNADAWLNKTAPNAPLYDCAGTGGIAEGVKRLLDGKVSSDKIMISTPSTGFSFATGSHKLEHVNTKRIDGKSFSSYVYQNIHGADSAPDGTCGKKLHPYTGEYAYTELIAEGILSKDGKTGLKGYKRQWDTCTKTPYLWNAKSEQLILYEDAESAAAKAEFARKNNLKGTVVSLSDGFDNAVYKSIADALHSRGGRTTHPPR